MLALNKFCLMLKNIFSNSNSPEECCKNISKTFQSITKKFEKESKKRNSFFRKDSLLKNFRIYRTCMAALSYGIYEFSKSSQEYSYKANIICRIRDRIFLAVDESIVLISYGYGVTAFSNIRLILENIALAAYISKISEKEAETFLPFAEKQKADFHIKSKEWFKQLGGETGERKRIESLNEEKFTELYDEACAYIHASPYSLDEIPQKLRDNEFDKKALFPYGYEKTIIAFFDLCSYFMNFMVQHLVSDEKLQEQCIETNNMLVEALLLKIRK